MPVHQLSFRFQASNIIRTTTSARNMFFYFKKKAKKRSRTKAVMLNMLK